MSAWLDAKGLGVYAKQSIAEGYDDVKIIPKLSERQVRHREEAEDKRESARERARDRERESCEIRFTLKGDHTPEASLDVQVIGWADTVRMTARHKATLLAEWRALSKKEKPVSMKLWLSMRGLTQYAGLFLAVPILALHRLF